MGLERGVENLTPDSQPTHIGGGFANYPLAIAQQSRTIRLPIHITENNKIKKGGRELAQQLNS